MEKLFNESIKYLKDYSLSSSLNSEEKRSLLEAIARLNVIKKQNFVIIKANDSLLKRDPGLIRAEAYFNDEKTLLETLNEAAKKDPELAKFLASTGGKLNKISSAKARFYDLGDLKESDVNQEEVVQLHLESESYYHNMWAVKKKTKSDTGI